MENGYAETSTLEIATRARVSKRELYALVGSKQEMLVACIVNGPNGCRCPPICPEPRDRESLARALATFGTQLLRETSDPTVIAVFRLAIAEAMRAPEVARALDSVGAETSRAALREVMTRARSADFSAVILLKWPSILPAALGQSDAKSAAPRRRTAEPPRDRAACPRRYRSLPATLSATGQAQMKSAKPDR